MKPQQSRGQKWEANRINEDSVLLTPRGKLNLIAPANTYITNKYPMPMTTHSLGTLVLLTGNKLNYRTTSLLNVDMLLHLHGLLFGVLGWVSVQHF